jgi:type II secretory pathway pseudopilin PulG
MILSNKKNGYTVVELIVYIAIFAVLSVGVINSLVIITKTYVQTSNYRHLLSDGELALERITREIRESTSINNGASSFNISPGILFVNGLTDLGVSKNTSFSVVNDKIQISQNGTPLGYLTSDKTKVTNLTFHLITTAHSNAVKISLSLETTSRTPMTYNFYTTVVLRGTY